MQAAHGIVRFPPAGRRRLVIMYLDREVWPIGESESAVNWAKRMIGELVPGAEFCMTGTIPEKLDGHAWGFVAYREVRR